MAGDWIPMRIGLEDEPEVVRIVSATMRTNCADKSSRQWMTCAVIGALQRTWGLFDRLTADGLLDGYSAALLNDIVGIPDFAQQLEQVGWLKINEDSLEMPGFDTFLGRSSKRRISETKRKSQSRASAKRPQTVRSVADKKRTTEQNRTEQNNRRARAISSDSEKKWIDYVADRSERLTLPDTVLDEIGMEFDRSVREHGQDHVDLCVSNAIQKGCRLNVPWWSIHDRSPSPKARDERSIAERLGVSDDA